MHHTQAGCPGISSLQHAAPSPCLQLCPRVHPSSARDGYWLEARVLIGGVGLLCKGRMQGGGTRHTRKPAPRKVCGKQRRRRQQQEQQQHRSAHDNRAPRAHAGASRRGAGKEEANGCERACGDCREKRPQQAAAPALAAALATRGRPTRPAARRAGLHRLAGRSAPQPRGPAARDERTRERANCARRAAPARLRRGRSWYRVAAGGFAGRRLWARLLADQGADAQTVNTATHGNNTATQQAQGRARALAPGAARRAPGRRAGAAGPAGARQSGGFPLCLARGPLGRGGRGQGAPQ